jgi:hypothetical protein
MIRFVFIAALLSAVIQARSQDTVFYVPKHTVALKIEEGPGLLRQCSRGAPNPVTGFWEVSPDTVALLEHNFWHIARIFGKAWRPSTGPTTHADSVKLQRELDEEWNQYIGIIVGRERYIYINHGGGT